MKEGRYLRTNEFTESVKAFESFVDNLAKAKGDYYYWKWAIIALHNSAQGFMVCALRGTNNLAVLTPECAKEMIEAYDKGKSPPAEKLDSFLNLYKKIKSNYMLQYIDSQKFKPTGTQGRSIKLLNSLRNDFIHFVPRGWSIEVSGMPKICDDVVGIIEFLVRKSGNIHFYPYEDLETLMDKLLTNSKKIISELKKAYGK